MLPPPKVKLAPPQNYFPGAGAGANHMMDDARTKRAVDLNPNRLDATASA